MLVTGGTIIHYQIKVNHILERGLPNISYRESDASRGKNIDDYS